MFRLITPLLAASLCTGCSDQSAHQSNNPEVPDQAATSESSHTSADREIPAQLTSEQTEFSNKWKTASLEERQTMAAVNKIGVLFIGATKTQIKEALGQPDESGVNKFGEDVMRYELGPAAGFENNLFQSHLTFVFVDDVVSNVMGNAISFAP